MNNCAMYRKVVGTQVVLFPSPLSLRGTCVTDGAVRARESTAALRQSVSISRPSAPGLNKVKSKDQSASCLFYSHMGLRGVLLPVKYYSQRRALHDSPQLHFIICVSADPQFIARRYSSYRSYRLIPLLMQLRDQQ
jgi:hypothetical protein